MHSSFWPWIKQQSGAVLAFAGLMLAVYGYQLPSLVYAGVLKHHHQTASDWVMLALMVITGAVEIYALSRLYRRRLHATPSRFHRCFTGLSAKMGLDRVWLTATRVWPLVN